MNSIYSSLKIKCKQYMSIDNNYSVSQFIKIEIPAKCICHVYEIPSRIREGCAQEIERTNIDHVVYV